MIYLFCSRGLVGPRRLFGKNGIYRFHPYGILIGAVLPVLLWAWSRRRPNPPFGTLHIPLVLSGPLNIPPATGINYSSWFPMGCITRKCFRSDAPNPMFADCMLCIYSTEYLVRIRKPQWWLQYNYILSSALDTGQCNLPERANSMLRPSDCSDYLWYYPGIPMSVPPKERYINAQLVGKHSLAE